jgi:hypothetical protein
MEHRALSDIVQDLFLLQKKMQFTFAFILLCEDPDHSRATKKARASLLTIVGAQVSRIKLIFIENTSHLKTRTFCPIKKLNINNNNEK